MPLLFFVGNRSDSCLPLLSLLVASLGSESDWADSDWADSDWADSDWSDSDWAEPERPNRSDICLPLPSFPVTSLGSESDWADSDWEDSDWADSNWSEPERPALFGGVGNRSDICLPFPCFLGFLATPPFLTPPFLGAFLAIGQSLSILCLILEPSVRGAEKNLKHLLLYGL